MKPLQQILSLFCLCLAIWSCTPGNFTPTEGITNYEEMKSVISELVPIGTPFELAKAKMEEEGFECSIARNSSFSEQGIGIEEIDYVYCDRHDYSGPYQSLRWQAGLIFENGIITRIALSSGTVAL